MKRVLGRDEQRLVARVMWIVDVHAPKIAKSWPRVREEDLRSVGNETLVTRSLSYDSSLGTTFVTHVYQPTYFAMLDYAHKVTFGEDAGIRALLRAARATTTEPDEAVEMSRTKESARENRRAYEHDLRLRAPELLAAWGVAQRTPEEQLSEAQERRRTEALVRTALERAAPEEQQIFRRVYQDGIALKDLAAELGYSERSMQRFHTALKERLRRTFVREDA